MNGSNAKYRQEFLAESPIGPCLFIRVDEDENCSVVITSPDGYSIDFEHWSWEKRRDYVCGDRYVIPLIKWKDGWRIGTN